MAARALHKALADGDTDRAGPLLLDAVRSGFFATATGASGLENLAALQARVQTASDKAALEPFFALQVVVHSALGQRMLQSLLPLPQCRHRVGVTMAALLAATTIPATMFVLQHTDILRLLPVTAVALEAWYTDVSCAEYAVRHVPVVTPDVVSNFDVKAAALLQTLETEGTTEVVNSAQVAVPLEEIKGQVRRLGSLLRRRLHPAPAEAAGPRPEP